MNRYEQYLAAQTKQVAFTPMVMSATEALEYYALHLNVDAHMYDSFVWWIQQQTTYGHNWFRFEPDMGTWYSYQTYVTT